METEGPTTGPYMILSDVLIEKGLLAPQQLEEALSLHRAEGLRLDRAIVELGEVFGQERVERRPLRGP